MLVVCLALSLAGCAAKPVSRELLEEAPILTPTSPTGLDLESLPPPRRKLDIAVYQFPDLTGKNEPNDNVAVFSRAVTQGGAGFVVDALQRAGHGHWFTVDERGGLNDLLQERQLVRATRAEFEADNARPLPPMRFAGLLLEGGIIGFDGNVVTGGVGANFLNIGGDVQYRQDTVTVAMRVVSVQSGEMLTSITTTKTVYSLALRANVYKFVSVDKLLQAEAGITRTEPTQLAVRQAIDLAVYASVLQGAKKGIWNFADPRRGRELLDDYLAREATTPVQLSSVPKKPEG
ncbi:CsgG/HfaB family protein [Hyphomicrobium sp.]|jgi:curli production assembly/transport component CsgG|uniref:CsgG/HfaB family protein n=1 Tax=Hyphomicrobium sp. TaxID=82 RepID=UPI003565279A